MSVKSAINFLDRYLSTPVVIIIDEYMGIGTPYIIPGIIEWKNFNGKNDRRYGPACVSFFEKGKISYQEWYYDGNLHNNNGAAIIWYTQAGKVELKVWCKYNTKHNENGPAVIKYFPDGGYQEEWYIYGKICNGDLPSRITYWNTGKIKTKTWLLQFSKYGTTPHVLERITYHIGEHFYDLEYHRTNGPAIIWYNPNEEIIDQEWYHKSKRTKVNNESLVSLQYDQLYPRWS